MDLRAIPAGGEHECQGRAQVPKCDVHLTTQMGKAVKLSKPLCDLWACARVGEGTGIVRRVTHPRQLTALACLPESFVGEPGQHPIEYRPVQLVRPGNHAAPVEV